MCTAILLFYFGIEAEDGSPFVFTTGSAQAMRLLRLAALGTQRDAGCLQGIVGTAQTGSGTGMSSFRQSHSFLQWEYQGQS
jgi:hypothetical protein